MALLAMLFAVQAHLPLLQLVAWGGMLVTYSARSGVEEGIRQTFDGDHPCPLCCAIQKAREHEAGRWMPVAPAPRLLACAAPALRAHPAAMPTTSNLLLHQPPCLARELDPPPVPPPRTHAV